MATNVYEGTRYKVDETPYYSIVQHGMVGASTEPMPALAILDEEDGGYIAFTNCGEDIAERIVAALNAYRAPEDDPAHVRTWRDDGFRLDLFDTYKVDSYGKTLLRYVFADNGQVIFQGEDFACSPLHDSDDAVATCLSFFALRPGDTDAEYFADYTEAQRAWMHERAEDLAVIVSDMENDDDG